MVVKQFMMSLLIVAALTYSSVRAVTDILIGGFNPGKADDKAIK
jgi:hypothetical protein